MKSEISLTEFIDKVPPKVTVIVLLAPLGVAMMLGLIAVLLPSDHTPVQRQNHHSPSPSHSTARPTKQYQVVVIETHYHTLAAQNLGMSESAGEYNSPDAWYRVEAKDGRTWKISGRHHYKVGNRILMNLPED